MSFMAKKSSRKFFLFGRYSLALLLPKKWLTELGINRGDAVDLEYDRKRRRIVIRPAFTTADSIDENRRSKPPKAVKAIESGQDNDLEPIPQID